MPTYEYSCTLCNHHFDVKHPVKEKPELSCPQCGGSVKKVFHAAGVIFKGSGWHIKDYATKSESAPAETPAKEPITPAASS